MAYTSFTLARRIKDNAKHQMMRAGIRKMIQASEIIENNSK